MSKTYTELIEDISTQEIDELYEYALLTEKNMSTDLFSFNDFEWTFL